MELREFFEILWRRRWVILLVTVAAIAVAAAGSLIAQPMYAAHVTVRVAAAPNPLIDRPDLGYAERIMNTYVAIARSTPILETVIANLGLEASPRDVRNMVSIELIGDTELMRITGNNPDPNVAAAVANGLARAIIADNEMSPTTQTASSTILSQLEQVQREMAELRAEYDRLLVEQPGETALITETGRSATVKQQIYETLLAQYDQARLREALSRNAITIIDPAETPEFPSTPRKAFNTVLGAVLGLMGGVGLSLLLELLDRRVYTVEQAQLLTNLPLLGAIPFATEQNGASDGMNPEQREAYRRLRTSIMALQQGEHPVRTIMVTSAEANEGKSTIVANVAASLASMGQSVLLVDCDMREPALHKRFKLDNRVGLSNILQNAATIDEPIQATSISGLSVLTSGPMPDDPTALLASDRMEATLKILAARYDYVLLDTPPVIPVVDAVAVAPFVDGIVQIIRSGYSLQGAAQSTFAQIEKGHGRTVGVVLNDAPRTVGMKYETQSPRQRPA